MASQPRHYLTAEEYLEIERRAHTKSEYFAGEMFAMVGGSREHSLIVGNTARSLHNQFHDRTCEVHTHDFRVKVSETGLYTYPDIVALCGKAELEDSHRDTLLNPMLVIEVLSDSTEAYDRGGKFQHYTKLESVQEYVLISQDRMLVERFRRQDENEWLLRIATAPDDVVDLQSVSAKLRVGDVYARVEFETEEDRPAPPEQ